MSDQFRDALHLVPYGFYAITSRHESDHNVMVANWFTQVSFEPRLVVLGLQADSHTFGLVSASQVFGVNIFRKADADIIKQFTKSRAKHPDKPQSMNYTDGPLTGVPLLDEAAATLECRVKQVVDAGGDHAIVVAEVVGAKVNRVSKVEDILTLTDIGWSYGG
jgi:flavin reductase (DIM6/NTAB) family NADH-FMN oxidoreductase RutF